MVKPKSVYRCTECGHGVALVWIVSPKFRTVEVHRPDADPQLVNVQQTLTADPALPGFSTPVRAIFE